MQERPQNYNADGDESEATLIAPRFDASDARHAHPVVPLEETRPAASFTNTRAPFRRGLKLSWPLMLMVVALVAVGAVGGAVATKVLRRPQPTPTVQASADVAPAQTSDAPPPSDTSAAASSSSASAAAPQAPREDAHLKRPSGGARNQAPEDGANVIAPVEPVRGGREEASDEGEGRHGHGRGKVRDKRDGRDENDDGEKEMRKTLKHAKGKLPRLVDVLTNP